MLLGSEVFWDWAKQTFLGNRQTDRHIPNLDKLRPKASVGSVVKQVSQYYKVPEESILRRGNKRNEARYVAIYLSRELSGHSCQALGAHFGYISGAAISARCKHVVEAMKKNRRFKREVNSIRDAVANS